MSSRRGGESGSGDSPRQWEEAKSTTPRLQPGSAGGRSAAPSAEMSSRGWGESGGGDSPQLQGDSSSCKKAKSQTPSLQPGSASEHVAASSATSVETGLEFGKVDGEAHAPRSPALGKATKALNRRAVAGGLDLDTKSK